MKKERVKGFIFGVALTLMLVSTVEVFASGQVNEKIEVFYNNIKLVVDGKPVGFGKDTSGKQIEPFVYKGTTYLPVRSVVEALGKKVDWDGSIQTVYIGEKPGEISYMTEIIEPYNSSLLKVYRMNESDMLSMGGVDYKTGYNFGGRHNGTYAYFNLNGKYDEITGILGITYFGDTNFDVYLDGNLYQSISLKKDELPKKISIPVTGVNQIRFEAGRDVGIGFADIIIK